jgi:small conductance mechanosensitive channel
MEAAPQLKRRRVDYGSRILKIIILFILLSLCLSGLTILFQWTDVTELPAFLQPYSSFLIFVSPYLRYFNAAVILVLGHFIVGEVGRMVYAYMRGFADHSSAATVQNVARIVGYGVLIAVLASVFSVDPAAALTLGSFGGLVVGFATQTFMSNAIAGIFVLVTRPFTFGDTITIATNTGKVKEIRMMHILIEALDGSQDILIPNSLVLSQIILKKRPGVRMGPTPTTITLEKLPESAKIGEKLVFKGRLTVTATGKPIPESLVILYDRDIGKDDVLVEGVTDADGNYALEWVVRKVDFLDDTAELYVRFVGDEDHRACNTKQYVVEVKN